MRPFSAVFEQVQCSPNVLIMAHPQPESTEYTDNHALGGLLNFYARAA